MRPSLIILVLLIVTSAFGQEEKGLVFKGNQLYKQKQYEKAAQEYRKAAQKNDKSVEAQYNLGNSLYNINKQEDAQKAYESAYDNSTDKTLKSKAAYNKGVLLTRQKKLQECIDAYKQSLRLNSEDSDTRENLQKALNELKKQQQQQQQNQSQNNQKQNQQEQPQQNNSKLNQKQAERMLGALRQQEKKIQQDVQNKNKQSGSVQLKDW